MTPVERRDSKRDADSRPLYQRFGWAYDLVVGESRGPSGEWVAGVFAEQGVGRGAPVVDAGCGTGRYALTLARAGFDVTGVDRSPELISQAERRARDARARITFVCADFLGWRTNRQPGAVLCRGVLNDLITDDERQAAFAAFAAWLPPGGVALIDVRDRDASLLRYSRGRVFEGKARRGFDALTFTSTTTADPTSDLLTVKERWSGVVDGVPLDHENDFRMRCWTPEALERHAFMAGFRRVEPLAAEGSGAREDRLVALAVR